MWDPFLKLKKLKSLTMTMFQKKIYIYIYIYIKSQNLWLKGFVALFQKKKKSKVVTGPLTMGSSMCVYLQKCHYNSVSIIWEHLKCVFNFHNSSLKNQRIEWWKQNLKTNPNKLSLLESHHFWVMGCKDQIWLESKTGMDPGPRSPNNEFIECRKES